MVSFINNIWKHIRKSNEDVNQHEDITKLEELLNSVRSNQVAEKENEDVLTDICTEDIRVETKNDEIEEIVEEKEKECNKEDEIFARSIIAKVIDKFGRTLKLSEGNMDCNLDEVDCNFVPIVGDIITIQAEIISEVQSFDYEGFILKYHKLRPILNEQVELYVTSYDTVYCRGIAGNDVYFDKDSFDANYTPSIGDKVAIQTITSEQGKCMLRALTLEPTKNQDPRNFKFKKAIEYFCLPKNGISITTCKFEVQEIGQQAILLVSVNNKGQERQIIQKAHFYLQMKDFQLEIVAPISGEEIEIYPGQVVKYKIRGTSKFYGYSKELLLIKFKNDFIVAAYLHISVGVENKSRAKFYKPCYEERVSKLKELRSLDNLDIIPGRPPLRPPSFIQNKLPLYEKPDYLEDAVFGQPGNIFGFQRALISILKKSPFLGKPLTIENYRNIFHTLLFLNEIDIDFKMRQYDMDKVCFRKFQEYLALDIDNLSGRTPSLVIGGHVIAVNISNKNEYPFDGCIHKINTNSIYLKFNEDFHSNYNGEEYNVKFRQSRVVYRKCHQAIDLAYDNLGEDILFPNKVKKIRPITLFKIENGNLLTQENNIPKNEETILKENKDIIPNNYIPTRLKLLDWANKRKQEILRENEKVLIQYDDNKWLNVNWINNKLNELQKEAVKNILLGEARPMPYIIFGPPGTGKTVTVVETILQILKQIPDSRILLASPSNSSTNLLTTRLMEFGLSTEEMIRLVAHHLVENDTIPPEITSYCATVDIAREGTRDISVKLLKSGVRLNLPKSHIRHRIVLGTCVCLSHLHTMGFESGYFSHVIVDEAGQASEPDIMIPLAHIKKDNGQIILAGDPEQLGPLVSSSFAEKFGLGDTFLNRLLERYPYKKDKKDFPDTGGYMPELVTRLTYNYRSVPEILKLSSDMFYDSELISQVSQTEGSRILESLTDILPMRLEGGPPSVIFHGIQGEQEQTAENPSWFNKAEAAQVLCFLSKLYKRNIKPDDVGIITPYLKQVQYLTDRLQEQNLPEPKIGSVESFQGQERSIIIISTVRTTRKQKKDVNLLGFVQNFRRLNVSITRAKSLLVIFGNPHLLAIDANWCKVIKYCVEIGGYIGCDLPTDFLNVNEILNPV